MHISGQHNQPHTIILAACSSGTLHLLHSVNALLTAFHFEKLQVERLPVFWKQQRLMFFDAFSFAFPAALQRIPYSLLVSLIWSVVTYWAVGLAGQPSRCFLPVLPFCPFPICSLLCPFSSVIFCPFPLWSVSLLFLPLFCCLSLLPPLPSTAFLSCSFVPFPSSLPLLLLLFAVVTELRLWLCLFQSLCCDHSTCCAVLCHIHSFTNF